MSKYLLFFVLFFASYSQAIAKDEGITLFINTIDHPLPKVLGEGKGPTEIGVGGGVWDLMIDPKGEGIGVHGSKKKAIGKEGDITFYINSKEFPLPKELNCGNNPIIYELSYGVWELNIGPNCNIELFKRENTINELKRLRRV